MTSICDTSVPTFSTLSCCQEKSTYSMPRCSYWNYVVADRHLRRSLYSDLKTALYSYEGWSLTINSRHRLPQCGAERMCTKCPYLAGKFTPYFSMGLGIYYTTTPETFALNSDLKVCASRLWLWIFRRSVSGMAPQIFAYRIPKLLLASLPTHRISGQRSVTRRMSFLLVPARWKWITFK